MPCSDSNYIDPAEEEEEMEREQNLQRTIDLYQNRNDKLARLLCEAVKILNDGNLRHEMSSELRAWSSKHDDFDRREGR